MVSSRGAIGDVAGGGSDAVAAIGNGHRVGEGNGGTENSIAAVVFGDAAGHDAFRSRKPIGAVGGDGAMGDGAVVGDDSEGAAAAHLHVFKGQVSKGTEGNAA